MIVVVVVQDSHLKRTLFTKHFALVYETSYVYLITNTEISHEKENQVRKLKTTRCCVVVNAMPFSRNISANICNIESGLQVFFLSLLFDLFAQFANFNIY